MPNLDKKTSIDNPKEFITTHVGWMHTVASRILEDTTLAQDAVQLAFIKIFEKIETFEGRSKLKSWMHRIVVNEALMLLRKNKNLKETSLDPLLPNFDKAGCRIEDNHTAISSEVELTQKQQTDIVREKINELHDAYRIIIIMRDIEGYTTSEVAEMLDMSEANVKIRLHRGRAALKNLLHPYIEGGLI